MLIVLLTAGNKTGQKKEFRVLKAAFYGMQYIFQFEYRLYNQPTSTMASERVRGKGAG